MYTLSKEKKKQLLMGVTVCVKANGNWKSWSILRKFSFPTPFLSLFTVLLPEQEYAIYIPHLIFNV